jgi:hypothetical protein
MCAVILVMLDLLRVNLPPMGKRHLLETDSGGYTEVPLGKAIVKVNLTST